MPELREQFQLYFVPQAQEEAAVRGANYRFIVLTERLVRLEYDPRGEFEDRPSQIFWYRDQSVPEFTVEKKPERVILETKYLKVIYDKNKEGFTENALRVNIKNLDNVWQYGDQNEGNLGGTVRTLDTVDGSTALEQGLLSRSGWSVVDDTESSQSGWKLY